MKLSEFIQSIGPKVFARRFGVTERAALSYQYGERRPRPAVALRIAQTTDVTLADIYGSPQRRKRAPGKRQRSTVSA